MDDITDTYKHLWAFTIPLVPPSLNRYSRMHWAQRNEMRDAWAWAVLAQVRKMRVPKLDKVHVSATIYFPQNRRRDIDNYVTVFKMLGDAIVKAGVVPDDDASHVTLSPPTFAKGGPCTVVTLRAR